ncbi:MAG: glycosyltransferase family 4 protein [bacterium]|nr:glycosyltransferase family 4 protein [bacterium]MBK7704107.1 glycosyltransferase family 4 protein [bacterium]
MHTVVIAALVSAAAGLALTPRLVDLLRRADILDIPNARSSHTQPIPVGGGLGILVPWLFGMAVVAAVGGFSEAGFPAALSAGAAVLAVLGFVDDRRNLTPLSRLVVESLVAAACIGAGGLPVFEIELPGFTPLATGSFGWALSWLFVVGFTNMFNFMDGINGLAGFQALLGASALAVWASLAGDSTLAMAAALLAGSSVGFLRANFPRAKVFMGDVGSLPLGFLLAMGVLRVQAGAGPVSAAPFWLPLLFVWPFLGDATYTLLNRAVHRRNPFRPHRSHIYQRLVVAGLSHKHVTLIYASAMLACIAAAFVCREHPPLRPYVFWGGLAVTTALMVAIVVRVRASTTQRDGHGEPAEGGRRPTR